MRGRMPNVEAVSNVLDQIMAGVREDVARREGSTGLGEMVRRAASSEPPLDAYAALARPGVSVIAEVKRRSPSKGELAPIADPAALASDYAAGGATWISVLTEERRFGARSATSRRCAGRWRSRCCARISCTANIRCTRHARTVPTWSC